jgi:hypothetical protein
VCAAWQQSRPEPVILPKQEHAFQPILVNTNHLEKEQKKMEREVDINQMEEEEKEGEEEKEENEKEEEKVEEEEGEEEKEKEEEEGEEQDNSMGEMEHMMASTPNGK